MADKTELEKEANSLCHLGMLKVNEAKRENKAAEFIDDLDKKIEKKKKVAGLLKESSGWFQKAIELYEKAQLDDNKVKKIDLPKMEKKRG